MSQVLVVAPNKSVVDNAKADVLQMKQEVPHINQEAPQSKEQRLAWVNPTMFIAPATMSSVAEVSNGGGAPGTSALLPEPHPQDLQHLNGNGAGPASNGSASSGRSTPSGAANGETLAPGKLFVGGLSWQTTPEKLKEYFGIFGQVTDVLIMKDNVTQRSRGFGFITFAEPSSIGRVLQVATHMLDGKRIDPKYATPKIPKPKEKSTTRTKKIFAGGVSQDTSEEEVKEFFSNFGRVEDCVMLMDQQTKRHRGFGFVTFESEDAVDMVCDIHYHTIKGKKVEVKRALPKESVQSAQILGVHQEQPHLISAYSPAGRRLMLTGLGMRIANPGGAGGGLGAAPASALSALTPSAASLSVVQAQAAQAQAAAAAAAAVQAHQSAAVAGRIFSYPITGYRFSPYTIPAHHAAAAVGPGAVSAANPPPQPQAAPALQAPTMAPNAAVAANPYQGYNLANVDMSSFQGVDWTSMYQLGMY